MASRGEEERGRARACAVSACTRSELATPAQTGGGHCLSARRGRRLQNNKIKTGAHHHKPDLARGELKDAALRVERVRSRRGQQVVCHVGERHEQADRLQADLNEWGVTVV